MPYVFHLTNENSKKFDVSTYTGDKTYKHFVVEYLLYPKVVEILNIALGFRTILDSLQQDGNLKKYKQNTCNL